MRLLRDLIHAQPVVPEQIGAIYLSEHLRANVAGYKIWDVLGVGPGRKSPKGVLIPVECKPGDRIVTLSYTTGPVDLEDGTAILTEAEVILVLEGLL